MLNYEFRYTGNFRNGTTTVSVNSDCYSTELEFAEGLAQRLRESIPFPVESFGKPSMHILGGIRHKGVMSVEMSIKSLLSDETMKQAFAGAGWFSTLEYILG
jgi:hypothetical protein